MSTNSQDESLERKPGQLRHEPDQTAGRASPSGTPKPQLPSGVPESSGIDWSGGSGLEASQWPGLQPERPSATRPPQEAGQEQPASQEQPPGQPPPARRRGGRLLIAWLVVLGLAATGTGSAMLVTELTRSATHAEVAAAALQEQASRWQRMTTSQAFPATVSYSSSAGGQETAYRVGIANQASCSAAVDPAIAKILNQYGCVTVLRATYSDASQTILGTVGVIIMRSTTAAQRATGQISAMSKGGLRVASFPGTIADRFSDSARESSRIQPPVGPYLFGYAGGFGDGRATRYEVNSGEVAAVDLGIGLITAVEQGFSVPANPCKKGDIRC